MRDRQHSTDAEEAVLTVFDAMNAALGGRRDGDTAWRLFADEEGVVMWGSGPTEVALGYAAIGALLRGIAASPSPPFTFRWDSRLVTVAGDVAWINAIGQWVEESAGRVETGPYRLTAVLVRRDGTWRCHTYGGSEPTPPGGPR